MKPGKDAGFFFELDFFGGISLDRIYYGRGIVVGKFCYFARL